MNVTFRHLRGLSVDGRADVAAAADAFDAAWQKDPARPPDLGAFLPADSRVRLATLVELACLDLGLRLRQGAAVRVEDYLGRFPELRADADATWALVAEECMRRGLNPQAAAEEYGRRFPDFAGRVRAWLCLPSLGDAPTASYGGPAGVSTAPYTGLPDLPGYEVLGVLGHGGMGVVYQARHIALKRLAAVKMILAGPHAGRDELARFKAEAEAVARLDHPNVVQIYEVGEFHGRPFLALEFCVGGGLDKKLNGAPLPPKEAASLAETLARAVHAAHRRGVVHRDLKPANVLLKEDGTPKVADFGLARRLDEDSGRTRPDAVMGTPSYMAPEQAAGKVKEVGPPADVWALGAILYELLTGRPPFRAATALETLELVRTQEPVPPRRLNPKAPRDLETICLKCLQKPPARRYVSAEELAEDLRRFRAGEPIQARPAGPLERLMLWRRRNPLVALWLALFLLALLTGTAVSSVLAFVASGWATEAEGKKKLADQKASDATTATNLATSRKREADDKAEKYARRAYISDLRLVPEAWEAGRTDRVRELLDEQTPEKTLGLDLRGLEWYYWDHLYRTPVLRLPGPTAGPTSVAFSPDGKWLAASQPGQVGIWDAVTGRPVRTPAGGAPGVLFSPDRKRLVLRKDRGLMVWDLDADRAVCALPKELAPTEAALSPDGRFVATADLWYPGSPQENVVRVFDAATGGEFARLTGAASQVAGLAFSPDGTRVAASFQGRADAQDSAGESPQAAVWDAGGGPPQLILKGRSMYVNRRGTTVGRVAFSPDGRLIAAVISDVFVGQSGVVRIWDAETGKEWKTLTDSQATVKGAALLFGNNGVAFSPNGRWLAAADGDRMLYVWDLDAYGGEPAFKYRGHATGVTGVAFSPDGTRLASAGDDGTVLVWGGESAQEESVGRMAGAPGTVGAAASPDGGRWAGANPDGTVRIWDAASGQPLRTLGRPGVLRALTFSPDGRRIACAIDKAVAVWDAADGRELLTLPAGGPVHNVVYSPDGRRLFAGFGPLREGSEDAPADAPEEMGKTLIDPRTGRPLGDEDPVEAMKGTDPPGEIAVWDAAAGELLRTLKVDRGPVRLIAVSPDGKRVAAARRVTLGRMLPIGDPNSCAEVRVWDADSGRLVRVLEGTTGPAGSLSFSHDGAFLAEMPEEGFRNYGNKVWDLADGRLAPAPTTGQIVSAAWNPDGRLATKSAGFGLTLWDPRTGRSALSFQGHTEAIYQAAFSPDGARLASQSGDGTVRVWETNSGQELLNLKGTPAPANALTFSPDGRRLTAVIQKQFVVAWGVVPDPSADALAAPAAGYEWLGDGRRPTWWGDNHPPIRAPRTDGIKPLLQDEFSDPAKGFKGAVKQEKDWEFAYRDGRYVILPRFGEDGGWVAWNGPEAYPPESAVEVVGRAVSKADEDGWGVFLLNAKGDQGCAVSLRRDGTVSLGSCPAIDKLPAGPFPRSFFAGRLVRTGDAFNTLLLVVRNGEKGQKQLEIYVNGVRLGEPVALPFSLSAQDRLMFSLAALPQKPGMSAEFKSVAVWPADRLPPPEKPAP